MLLTRDWRTTTIAIVAAYAIVVQALLLATSGAFHAASSSTDPLGIICTEHGSIPAPPDTPARHSHDKFLAPEILGLIVAGRQPTTLTAERLKACRPLPLDWNEQRELLLG